MCPLTQASLACMFSSMRLDYATPREIFDQLDKEFDFTLDPCASKDTAKCRAFFDGVNKDGLKERWSGRVFMNPPYGRELIKWMRKAWNEYFSGHCRVIVCLIPSRTDTKWWHEYAMRATEIRFIRGRVRFYNNRPAPFPSAVVIFRG